MIFGTFLKSDFFLRILLSNSLSNRAPNLNLLLKVSHDGRKAFSLDGAKTKFPCLEHLVDFYKMNSGPLPILLKDTTINRLKY